MDFDFLRRKGIEAAQRLSGKIWTDYNEHDPGVTIIEALAFAITDLGYRTDMPIEDLIFSQKDNKRYNPNNAFYSPTEILPSGALTANDYRKLILDRIGNVENAWVEEANTDGNYKGIHTIKLQLHDHSEDLDTQELTNKVRSLLMSHRNLCEDFEDITILKAEKLQISADINLYPDAIAESVLANILSSLEDFLNKQIRRYSFDRLEDQGIRIEDILEGPLTNRGFIDDKELDNKNSTIYVSQLREVILSNEGVVSIEKLVVRKNGVRQAGDEISAKVNDFIVLSDEMHKKDPSRSYPIRLLRNNTEVRVNYFQMYQDFLSLRTSDNNLYGRMQMTEQRSYPSKVKIEDISTYYSIQRLFPAVYGIGSFGLYNYSNRRRKNQVKQLKGYLLIFEQFLSGYLAQLSNFRDLFSLEAEYEHSYFSSFPFDCPDVDSLLMTDPEGSVEESDKRKYVNDKLTEITHQSDIYNSRRNKFLDHLLARFGEVYKSEFLITRDNHATIDDIGKTNAAVKVKMLNSYIEMSRDRAQAYNYTRNAWEDDQNISTLKKRICTLLDIENCSNKFLANNLALEEFNLGDQLHPSRTKVNGNSPYKNGEVKKRRGAKLSLPEMLSFGTYDHCYEFKQDGEDQVEILFRKTPEASPRKIMNGINNEDASQKLKNLIKKLNRVNKESSGFYIVEHILLRPKSEVGALIKMSVLIEGKAEPVIFQSISYDSPSVQRKIGEELIHFGAEINNYEIIKGGNEFSKKYFILLRNNGKAVMTTAEEYTLTQGVAIRSAIVQKLNEIRIHHAESFSEHIEIKLGKKLDAIIESDFFNMQLSIVVPTWPANFNNPTFQNTFSRLIAENVPAHLGVNFKWLNYSEFKEFEQTYYLWLNEKSKDFVKNSRLDRLTVDVIAHLVNDEQSKKELKNYSMAISNKLVITESMRRGILNKKDINLKSNTGDFELLFNETDLQIVKGIDAQIELVLKKNGIDSWGKLADVSIDELDKLMKIRGLTEVMHTSTWPKQARLALRGLSDNTAWKELIWLQKNVSRDEDKSKSSSTWSKIEKFRAKYMRSKYEPHSDLTNIEGIDERIQRLLNRQNIRTYEDLSRTRLSELSRIVKSEDIDLRNIKIASWSKLAKMLLTRNN